MRLFFNFHQALCDLFVPRDLHYQALPAIRDASVCHPCSGAKKKHELAGAVTPGFASWLKWLMGLLLVVMSFSAAALNCATPGKDGAGGTLNGTINRYWPGSASASATSTSISISISLGTSIGGSSIAIGDLLLVIQMQDAAINSTNSSSYGDGASGSGSTTPNNTGLYEYVRATSTGTNGGSVTIVGGRGGGLLNAYTNAAANGTQGQRRFQVVRVPQYTTATLSSGLTAAAWDGRAGGVLVFDVAGELTLAGTASVDGLGFRGGGARQINGNTGLNSTDYRSLATLNANGGKGEGIAGTPRYVNSSDTELDTGVEGYPNGSYARGAPGNAGGGGTDGRPSANDQNTGGGGGSNAGKGGKGGNAWNSSATTGGWGGSAYSISLGPGRLFLGGGGGAGTTNNGTGSLASGFASSGAAGGGLVMIRAGSITGIGVITANGVSANSTVLNDGSGGGGAGGSVLVYSSAGSVGSLTIHANGGNGGSNTGLDSAHGPGGGGSGGYVVTSGAATVSYTGGAAGTTGSGKAWYAGNFGATDGTGGASATVSSADIPGVKSGNECAIVIVKSFSPSPIVAGGSSTLSVTLTSSNNVEIIGIVLSDVFPTTPGAMKVATPLTVVTNTCTGTLLDSGGGTLAAGDVGVRLNAGVLTANGSCIFSIKVSTSVVGTYTNTIAAGALVSANGGRNGSPASATLIVGASSLVFLKTVSATSDPSNGAANPKNIPGAEVLYNLRVTNTGIGTIDNNSTVITDPIPANTELFVGDLGVASSPGPIAFVEGTPTSTLIWTYTSLASTTDDVAFSDIDCVTFTYVPVPTLNYDPAVKCIRLNPKGTLASASGGSNPYFELRFRVRIK